MAPLLFRFAVRSFFPNHSPVSRIFARKPPSTISSSVSRPSRHATGFPPNVVPCCPAFTSAAILAPDEDGAERQAAAERLGEEDEVGRDAELLEDEEVPRPPEAALDLVEDERGAHAVGGRARGGDVLGA